MRRPVNIPPARLGDGDAAHARRGVGAAQDYACAIGTPVYAMFPVRRIAKTGGPDAAGGHTLIGYADGRNYWVVQHLSAWQMTVSPDGRVALSGNSGTQTDGPHVHAYVVIDGVRMNPERWLAMQAPDPTPAAVGPATPLPTPPKEDDMPHYLIEHAAPDVQGGWYNASPGHWHRLTPPELDQALIGAVGAFERRTTNGNWALLVRWHDMYAPIDIDLNGNKIDGIDTETIASRAEVAVRGEVAELRALIASAGITVDIDEDAIAQRVRDEFTARPLG